MAPSVEELIQQRGVLKGRITRFMTYLDTANSEEDFDEIQIRMGRVERVMDEFETVQSKIEFQRPGVDDEAYREEFERAYYTVIKRARQLIRTDSASTNSTVPLSQRSTSFNNNASDITNTQVRLPKIDLPTFSGSYESWLSFYDTFNSIIHTNDKISNIQKLHYLRSCLKDEAATIIRALETTEGNYDIAWSLLKERFDNKRVIVQNHLRLLLEQPTMHKETAASVRQLLDNIQTHSRALTALGQSVETWDTILIYCMTAKLDRNTHREWEKTIKGTEIPKMEEFLEFLKLRCQILEATSFENTNTKTTQGQRTNSNSNTNTTHATRKNTLTAVQATDYCNYCKKAHKIFNCESFLQLPIPARNEAVKKARLSFNCLRKNHAVSQCVCGPCKKCNRKHHTLLHQEAQNTKNTETEKSSTVATALQAIASPQVLLSTAEVNFLDVHGNKQTARVILDSGSQMQFVTEKFANSLGLPRDTINIPVEGLNQMETRIKSSLHATIFSKHNDFSAKLQFLISPRICDLLPIQFVNRQELNIPRNVVLADPEFHKPAEIDALLGAEIFFDILCIGQIQLRNHGARLQKTKLGWIIAGKVGHTETPENKFRCHLSLDTINNQIEKFWSVEETPETKLWSNEEITVEQHFLDNTSRDKQGRYVVKLPFKENKSKLGDTYSVALKRFHTLERKLDKNTDLKQQYSAFMKEYEDLKHMTKAENSMQNEQGCFLPHHAVIKQTSATTKVRVVFDGSAKSSTGISLNDVLRVGPTIQEDIFSLLIRFRMHTYVLIADIEKMYRQVLIHEDDRKFQKILWRENSNDAIKTYYLNTVTYGTAPAPFLATRSLHQLADDEETRFPIAAKVLKRDFYVDDLLTGSDTIDNAARLRDETQKLLSLGGFKLRQWSSNELELIDPLSRELTNLELFADPSQSIKTLGIHWNAQRDALLYTIKDNQDIKQVTKRMILSKIAQLFDPIGLLGPITVKAKLIMQRLWQLSIDWDESVPLDIHTMWNTFEKQLPLLNEIEFHRQIICQNSINIQLHGFCDASESAYGACVYIRSTDEDGHCITRLVCSKTRVAPLKVISLPRLELCAALLLAKLYRSVSETLPIVLDQTFFWSDSTITLNWINTQPHALKTFVANRVSQIRAFTNYLDWKHVPSKENPADFISRGQTVIEFTKNQMWPTGPQWLVRDQGNWPSSPIQAIPVPELRKKVSLKIILNDSYILTRYSSFQTLTRVIAYCIRFAKNSLGRDKTSGPLKTTELHSARIRIIQLVQNQEFAQEISDIQAKRGINNKSSLRLLGPFLDDNHLLRVGGRLKHSEISFDRKHPILLPKRHHITDLIIRQEHERTFHSGIQNTLYQVRMLYWPINGKDTSRRIIHSCVKCARFRNTEIHHVMGNLPKNRLVQSRPFLNTGVDYCGPFFIKEKKHRNRGKVKTYVAAFICFATKAIHLELVTDLTTEAFISSLKRFFARRGKSKNMYSDNATNFVGANRELNDVLELVNSENHKNSIFKYCADQGIDWHFIPPRSPHFGGLWEAAVKSFKNHFHRTVGDTLFTYEELNTYVIEIEAILNSRPITPLSSDPNDLRALSPSHFLIGDSLTTVPEADFSETAANRLSQWQHIQRVKQHFWKRWHKEYLNQLNIRSKWHQNSAENISIGTMVLMKEDNLPPLHWAMGRITDVHPGDDNIIRVVTVKTANGIYKRSVKKNSIIAD